MHDVAITVFGVTGLLALVSLLSPLAGRLNLPFSVVLAVVGCALGAIVIGVQNVDSMGVLGDFIVALRGVEISSEAFLYIFLPTLLFEAALAIDVRRLMDDLAPILLLAVVAVVVCMLVVGFALVPVSDVGLLASLLLGAIVATTDPVAVVGIFRDLGAPRRLVVLVEGESLFNDAAAIALSSLLLAMLLGIREADAFGTALAFLKGFLGGAIIGYLAARVTCVVVGLLRGQRLAEITLTVALAYLVYVVAERYFHVSGVVAVVVAGLVIGSHGRVSITPSTWDTLVETWEQLGFWASSLIFLFAAMLMPRILLDIEWRDALLLAVLVFATLGARAVVLWGLLPLLSFAKLAGRISNPFRIVILWGGLRGAISLALALAVSENPAVPPAVQQFVAGLTTCYVLFTLFVNGTTLRALIRVLQLDRLSPVDRAVRNRALTLSLTQLKEHIESVAVSERTEPEVAIGITQGFGDRIAAAAKAQEDDTRLSNAELLQIGLITLASREQEIYLQRFKERIISRKIVQLLLVRAGRLLDGAKTGGHDGYAAAASKALDFPWTFRLALALHDRLGIDRWLAVALADRFERLQIGGIGLRQLVDFNQRHLAPLLGPETGDTLTGILEARIVATEKALAALKLQYPAYARTLEIRYLGRVAARLEGAEYQAMLRDSMISREVYADLDRRLGARWQE
ncbi:MAG: cation:proton antiporter, partial [Dongiaceae bacterium]